MNMLMLLFETTNISLPSVEKIREREPVILLVDKVKGNILKLLVF